MSQNKAESPFSNTVWDACELWPRDRITAYQTEQLKTQLVRVGRNSAHYRGVFAACGFDPETFASLDDLRRLPLTRKKDYVAGLAQDPPFGTFRAVDVEDAVRVHFSSGTTAAPAPVLWSAFDADRWAGLYARYLYAQGLRKTDVFHCMFGYSWFVGGLGASMAAQKLGALVIPGGSVDTQRQIDTILQYKPRCVIGTPSFMAHIAEAAIARGIDLASSSVEMVCVGGEPGASIPGTREKIERQFGAKMFDCYGALECQPIGWDTAAQTGPTLAEDFIYVEILDPKTDEPVPDGTPGVLVLTHLDKEACPLVRWWTGDIVVRDSTPAADGRTHARLVGGVHGRGDDMLIVRGVNLFPSAVEDVVRAHPGTTNEYVLVVNDSMKDPNTGMLRRITLRVEREDADDATLGDTLKAALRAQLNVSFEVEVLDAGALPRTVHKATRVVKE
ncbi:phenylacetate--CoA ligase family protein [Puniceibacterium sp. IMCC21224]|uniref:phenylacetate--CoA ligase family protein n=1 Tax=Puniceibacterium sp. IMCC21224 TaxID=1618204 RepID=UPI00064DE7C2|nr:AMP-binding protein [Puniceibacterium sp. IMCC21224]KMK65065.1 coenzyme F390 synthetase [Puniceibacterium sp. IMCC21224]